MDMLLLLLFYSTTVAHVVNRDIVTIFFTRTLIENIFARKHCCDYISASLCLFIGFFVVVVTVVVLFNNHLTSFYFSCSTIYVLNLCLM